MKKISMKKALAILLSFMMILPTFTQAFAANTSGFTDFPTGWSKEAVSAAVANGLLNGRTPTTIEPTGNLTRAELATIINRAFGATKMADISSFKDVSSSDWFYTEIAKAVNMQTFQGDGTGTMRPNDPIKREEVFAVVARALVLETSDYSALSSHPDASDVSAWAKPYAAILSQKGYINGDANGNLNPQANITREEFAQVMHNIIKTYYTTSSTFSTSGSASSLIRTPGVTLKNVTIEGDLIIGDGVGNGTVILDGVTIKGRLLARGGEGSVKLVNTTVGDKVVVKDVNGVVNFDNYRTDAPFKNIVEITPAKFKTASGGSIGGGGGGSGGGGSGGGGSSTSYMVSITGAGFNKNESVIEGRSYTLPTPDTAAYPGFAGWKLSDGTIKNAGESIVINSNTVIIAVFSYKVEHYFETYQGSGIYNIDNAKTQNKKDESGANVTAVPLSQGIDGYVYDASNVSNVLQGIVNASGTLVLKLYYNSTTPLPTVTYTLTVQGAGQNVNISLNSGDSYTLPTPDMSAYAGFAGWRRADGTIIAAGTQIVITENLEFVAVYTYKTEHYFETYQGSGVYDINHTKTAIGQDVEGANITASALTEGIDGYVFNAAHASTVASGIVTVDGVLVLKLYYDSTIPQTTVYTLTIQGAGFNETESLNVGSTYTLPTPNMSSYAGFAGWRLSDGSIVSAGTEITMTGNLDFVAVYTYKVEHYLQSALGSSVYNADGGRTEIKTDIEGASVSASSQTISGYTYNASHISNVTQGAVSVDGTLILKFYYNIIDTRVPGSYKIEVYRLESGDINNPAEYSLVHTSVRTNCYVGDNVVYSPGDELGYVEYFAISTLSGVVTADGSLTLKLYLYRIHVRPVYNLDGGRTKDGYVLSEDTMPAYSHITLPDVDNVEKDGFRLAGWTVTGDRETVDCLPGDTIFVRSESDFTVTAVWAPLYEYKIKFHMQNLTKTGFEVDESLTIGGLYGLDGETVRVSANQIPTLTGFTYSPELSQNYLEGTVSSATTTELGLYYTRNDIQVSYSFANGGQFTDGSDHTTTVVYGSTITLPAADEVQNGYDVLLYWSFAGVNYPAGSQVTVEGYDPQEGWVFTAVWQTTTIYTVNFNSQGYTLESYTLPENTSVPQSVFDGLDLWEQEGYVESADISPVYAGNEYTHKVKFGWYYNPATNTWEKFTSSTLVTAALVDANGILTVEERSPQLSIYAYLSNLDQGFTFTRYYEPTVTTVDGSGNTTTEGTRVMDTFKNFLWDSFSGNSTLLQSTIQEQIEKGGDKLFAQLKDRGIIDSNKNILPFELFIRFSQIIGDELETYIVDNAKDSLSDNDELKDAILEYFERMANSENPEDVSEVKSLFKEAIDRALTNDSSALNMIRDICESSLDDASIVKSAFEDFVGYNVTVTDADLTANAKTTIIKWTKDLINTDPTFKANVKERLVKYITDQIVSSDGFFEDVVGYNFAGTPFEDLEKPSASLSTTDMIIDVVEAHFASMSADEIAVELGYTSLNDLFNNRKEDIINVLISDLNNESFFNHVITATKLKDYTYAEIRNALTLDIIIDFINNSIDSMTRDELADFAGYASGTEMMDKAIEKMGDILADNIRDESDSAYGDVLQKFIGQSSVPSGTTSADLFKEILKKVVADAQSSADYSELELMTGEVFSSMTTDEINTFFANFNTSLDDTDILNEYIKEASHNVFPTVNDLPSSSREFMARFVEIYFVNNTDYVLEKLGYTQNDIFEKAKEYAKDEAKDKVSDPTDSFLVAEIEKHTGYVYANYASVPQYAFDLVIDIVKNKVNSATNIDDNLAHELGYDDMDSLFREIEDFVLDDVEEDIRTDSAERDRYITEYSGITFTEPIKENAMDFIVQYAKAVLDPMTYDDIKAELIAFGMTEEDIDGHIEDYISDNLVEIIEDEFGYCPVGIETLDTKEFITELVLYFFDNDAAKRDAIINKAIDYLVDGGDLTEFEEYVDHAIDYLRETNQLDEIIDDIIEAKYRDVLDRMVYQLINEDEFEITSSNSFILTAFEMQVRNYSFNDLIADIPQQIFRLYPREKLEAIYTRAYNELLLDIEEGKTANLNGQTARIATGLNFRINLIDDVYVVFRDRFVELLDEKATANYYYRENKYLRELVRLTSAESLFKTNTGVGTGYAFKDYEDYYNLLLAIVFVGDDAIKWYTEELSPADFNQLVLNYEELFLQYTDIIADMVGDYADEGELPDRLDNSLIRTVESKIREKFGDKIDTILNRYKDSVFNRENASNGYSKLRQIVNKAFKTINITTDEVFNLIAKGYNLVTNKFDGLGGIDRLDQISADIYEVTIKGKTLRVERKDADTYKLSVQGKSITISEKDNSNTFEIVIGANKLVVSRAIVE